MFNFDKTDLQRILAAATAALVMSTTSIAMTAAPVRAAEPCLVLPAHAGQALLCSHA